MKDFFQMLKPWDMIMIVVLVLLSFLPLGLFTYEQAKHSDEHSVNVAVIKVNNEEIKRIQLTGNTEIEVFDLVLSEHEVNTIEVDHERIHMKSATCSDQVCVRTGYISKPGETIVCLPHKIVIEIQTTGDQADDMIISS